MRKCPFGSFFFVTTSILTGNEFCYKRILMLLEHSVYIKRKMFSIKAVFFFGHLLLYTLYNRKSLRKNGE